MKSFWNSAFALLVVTGGLLGLTLPFGKLATAAGIPGMLWAFVISIGAGGILLLLLIAWRRPVRVTARMLRYFLITAAISYAFPNFLLFTAIPHLGAGYAGIMYTLSPVVTLVLSLLIGVRRPNLLGIAGIVVGFVGALMVALTRGQADRPANIEWVLIGLLIPVCLGVGNIYRSYDWPKDAGPIELAAGSHLAAAAMLLAALIGGGDAGSFLLLASLPLLVLAQVLSSALMFAVYFRLQAVGGPVYLSQIGYVAAALALGSGVLFLGEHYRLLTWAGAAIIALGVVMTTKAQARG